MPRKKRLEDPKADAKPDLAYGGSSLSVDIETDDNDNPEKLVMEVEIELPIDTKHTQLNQDLLADGWTITRGRTEPVLKLVWTLRF